MVYISGEPSDSALQKPLSFISEVESLRSKASAADVVFREPDYFTAGELHQHYEVWEHPFLTFHNLSKVSLKARIMIRLSHLK